MPRARTWRSIGLTKPTGTIVVKTGSSSATLTLGSTENALLFAKDSSRPMVFTIAPVLKDDVIRTVSDFRRKDLFDGRAFTATRAELKRGAETIVLEKSKGKDNMDVWKSSGKDVDAAKVDDLLTKVTGLRAASFEDKPHPRSRRRRSSSPCLRREQAGNRDLRAIGHRRIRKPFG